jgi:nucleoside-diphosphate-sugar epimerase
MILVTGSTGFLGFNFIKQTLKQGESVVALVRQKNNINAESLLQLQGAYANRLWIEMADITHQDTLNELLNKYEISKVAIKAVVHFAGQSNANTNEADVNVIGTKNLADRINKYAQSRGNIIPFIFSSSIHAKDKITPYAESKRKAEEILQSGYSNLYCSILRIPNMLGPNQHTKAFLPTVLDACYKNQPMPVASANISYLTTASLNNFIIKLLNAYILKAPGSVLVKFEPDHKNLSLIEVATTTAEKFDNRDKYHLVYKQLKRNSIFKVVDTAASASVNILEDSKYSNVENADDMVSAFHDTRDIDSCLDEIVGIKLEKEFNSESNPITQHFDWGKTFFRFVLPKSQQELRLCDIDIITEIASNQLSL